MPASTEAKEYAAMSETSDKAPGNEHNPKQPGKAGGQGKGLLDSSELAERLRRLRNRFGEFRGRL